MTTPASPCGDLIVRSGKHPGRRLPLRQPITVIGSGEGCDVRLTAEGISPIHALIVQTAEGPMLRVLAMRDEWAGGNPLNPEAAADDRLIANGDEVTLGSCVFLVDGVPAIPGPISDGVRTELAQLSGLLDERNTQLDHRGHQVSDVRFALRLERKAEPAEAAEDRKERQRLLLQASEVYEHAVKARDRARKLAVRFIGRVRRRGIEAQRRLDAERAGFDSIRAQLADTAEKLEADHLQLSTASVLEQQKHSEIRFEFELQQRRLVDDRTETESYFRRQEAALDARNADLERRERRGAKEKARLEAEIAAKRSEAESLETRVHHARAALKELEQKRNAVLAQPPPPPAPDAEIPDDLVALDRRSDRDLFTWAAELDRREKKLKQDQAAIAPLKIEVDRATGENADRSRVLAEQFGLLIAAQNRWAEAERHTVAEMEDLAHVLGRREKELDERERCLMTADRRRREESHELWRLRLKLEGWRGVLTANEKCWQAEHAAADASLLERTDRLAEREARVGNILTGWNERLEHERQRLIIELNHWVDSRVRLDAATTATENQRTEWLMGVKDLAAKQLALEELMKATIRDSKDRRAERRFEVFRRRWERTFAHQLRDMGRQKLTLAKERQQVDARYDEHHKLLIEVASRNADALRRAVELERATLRAAPDATKAGSAGGAEMVALRAEVERLAYTMMNAEWPVPRETPAEESMAMAEPANRDVLPFEALQQAA